MSKALQPIKNDRWSERYTTRSRSPTPSPSLSLTLPASSTASALVLAEADGPEIRAYASTLSPAAERALFACACCKTAFGQDQSVYPVPADSRFGRDDLVCESCFADNFSRGACEACAKPVLGNKLYVKHAGRMWHAVSGS